MTMLKGKNAAEETSRNLASAAFVAVLLLVGGPLWWKTTAVYRVSLPYKDISNLHTLYQKLPAHVTVLADDEPTAGEVSGLIERAFQVQEDADLFNLHITKNVIPEYIHNGINSASDEPSALKYIIDTIHDIHTPGYIYLVQRKELLQDVWVGSERVILFRNEKSIQTLVEVLMHWIYETSVLKGAISQTADDARRTRFPPGDYHIALSVVNPQPDKMVVSFNAKNAVEDYIGSFVDELSDIHNFTLKSQWLYQLNFDFQAKEVKHNIRDSSEWGRHFAVSQDRLHLLITRLEDRTATHVSELPTINLVLYVVPCHMAPLRIYCSPEHPVESPVQAFMSPKWGGVVFANPTEGECKSNSSLLEPPVRVIMGTFLAQLRELVGITQKRQHQVLQHIIPFQNASAIFRRSLSRSLKPDEVETMMTKLSSSISGYEAVHKQWWNSCPKETKHARIPNAHLDPLRSVMPRYWETDSLLRLRTLEQLNNAITALQSLAQMLAAIPYMVINDEAGTTIKESVNKIHLASSLLKQGDLLEASRAARAAYRAADVAANAPSLMEMLYFPDDQKYAIYIPLFLPVMFPVVLSLKNLYVWFRGLKVKKD